MDPAGPEKQAKRPWLRLAGTFLAAALLIFWLAQNWSEVVEAFSRVGWEGFLLALVLTVVSRFSTVGRWHSLLRSAGTPVRVRQSIELTFAGLFSANFLPTTVGGDLVRLAGGIRLGFDAAVTGASLVADRLVGMAGMATVLPLGLWQAANLPSAAATGALAPVFLAASAGGEGGLRKAARWAWEKVGQLWRSLLHALHLWLTHPLGLLLAYGFTWGHMAATFLSVWFMFQRMGENIPLWLVAGCWSMSYFPTLLPVSINGLGVQELTLTFFFVQFGGVSQSSALVMAALMRILPALVSLPGAFFVPGLLEGKKAATERNA